MYMYNSNFWFYWKCIYYNGIAYSTNSHPQAICQWIFKTWSLKNSDNSF